ncbi:hypothetical protein [Ensifer adhaerens]|uniref:Uncharacterized protein n=1 Tax=Ensifer adhaerens TaxID=106592 RepID=A0A9Q9DEN7_ENSAD|nr:hypothetical protein [Ensifer adhaerens]USJ28601.1 hypothetical protein NE863_35670 [Ensifer adhaerens]
MPKQPTNIRQRAIFVPHARIPWRDGIAAVAHPDNVVIKAQKPDEAWIEDATSKIGEWRSLTRSVYLRWAITINASELAQRRYEELPEDQALRTDAMRIVNGEPTRVTLSLWPAREAAEHYRTTTPLIAAYGVSDLFGALEDIIFDLYEIVLRHNPQPLMQGPDFRDLRRLWHNRSNHADSEAAWRTAWLERYSNWRRKRAYDGLGNVLIALYQHAGLRRPSSFKQTDVADWARTLEMIAELRNLIVHGAATVSQRLAELSNTQNSLTFDFLADAVLDVRLHHLQSVECFCDQLLNAFNISLVEKAVGPLDRKRQRGDG